MSVWQVIITTLGGQAILFVALGFLLKIFTSHLLKKDLETYKATMKYENSLQIEQFKAELRASSKEREIRFTTLHKKVALIFGKTYERLHHLYHSVGMYSAAFRLPNGPSRDEQLNDVNRVFRQFRDYFYPRRIYFPEELGKRIEDCQQKLQTATEDLATAIVLEETEGASSRSAQFEAYKKFVDELKPLLDELRAQFRVILIGKPIEP